MNEELLDKFLKTLKEEFKENKEDIYEGLKDWGKIILQMQQQLLFAKNETDRKRIMKTEKYAWAGINALKTKQYLKFEKNTWVFVEKSLKIIKNVVLS